MLADQPRPKFAHQPLDSPLLVGQHKRVVRPLGKGLAESRLPDAMGRLVHGRYLVTTLERGDFPLGEGPSTATFSMDANAVRSLRFCSYIAHHEPQPAASLPLTRRATTPSAALCVDLASSPYSIHERKLEEIACWRSAWPPCSSQRGKHSAFRPSPSNRSKT